MWQFENLKIKKAPKLLTFHSQIFKLNMSDPFDLPVTFNGKELLLPAELLPMGFSYKIKVTVEGIDVLFEPDEEKNYRATVSNDDRDKASKLNKELLQVISEALHELLS